MVVFYECRLVMLYLYNFMYHIFFYMLLFLRNILIKNTLCRQVYNSLSEFLIKKSFMTVQMFTKISMFEVISYT